MRVGNEGRGHYTCLLAPFSSSCFDCPTPHQAVSELLVLAQFSILIKLLLQKVLYRFDVVICSRLDGFDALCIF